MSTFVNSNYAIVACSSGMQSNSAVAIIRLSGFEDLKRYQPFFEINLSKMKARKSYLTRILNKSEVLDQCLLFFHPAPHSYTGENVLELNVHGNVLNIKKILTLLASDEKTKLALPGEFTYRALLNKKISLVEVEGLDLVLNAKNDFVLKSGQAMLNGKIGKLYQGLYDRYLSFVSALELAIDFSEDVGEEESKQTILRTFAELKSFVEFLAQKISSSKSLSLTPEVVISGRVNSGKSSFFNYFIQNHRAIISSDPGTTRDFISEEVHIKGIPFRIIDTAGIRDEASGIEAIGISKGKDLARDAFFSICMVNPFDQETPLDLAGFDLVIFSHCEMEGFEKQILRFLNSNELKNVLKISLKEIGQTGPIGAVSGGPIGAETSGPIGAKKNVTGPIGPVKTLITESIMSKYEKCFSEDTIFIERHCEIIEKINKNISDFNILDEYENDVALCASRARLCGHWIEQLIGVVSSDQILNSIFANFCIGK